jgi:hypothetical protein
MRVISLNREVSSSREILLVHDDRTVHPVNHDVMSDQVSSAKKETLLFRKSEGGLCVRPQRVWAGFHMH